MNCSEIAKLSPTSEDSGLVKKSSDVWYVDGSVVLVAENTAFRVHLSILADHCEVFRDMTSMPKPQNEESDEQYEGCPGHQEPDTYLLELQELRVARVAKQHLLMVVKLQDAAADLEHFLKAIYHFSKSEDARGGRHLSVKYIAHDLRHRAVELLITAFPAEFDAWEGRNETRLVPRETGALLALCHQTGVRVILPGVYYAAAKQPLEEVLDSLHNLPLDPIDKQEICRRFVLGREKLRQERAGILQAQLRAPELFERQRRRITANSFC